MAAEAEVLAHVDQNIKDEAATVLADMGLSVSDALRLLLTKVAHDKALPFEPILPNAATEAAVEQARRGDLERVRLDELQSVLDADD